MKKRNLFTASTLAVLACLLLFSCEKETSEIENDTIRKESVQVNGGNSSIDEDCGFGGPDTNKSTPPSRAVKEALEAMSKAGFQSLHKF